MLVLSAILPVFAIILLGFLLRRRGVMQPEADKSIIQFTINVTYPALILSKMIQDPTLHDLGNVWRPMLCAVLFMVTGMALAWMLAPLFGQKGRAQRGTFALACSIQNYGYLPLPILTSLFPNDHWAGVLFVYSLGLEMVLWTLGMVALGGKGISPLRQMLNPIVLSILIGLGLALLRMDAIMPKMGMGVLMGFLKMLGDASFPLGILMFGVTLSDVMQTPAWYRDWKTPAGGILLRLLLLPAMMLILGKWLSPGAEFDRVLAVQAAMPAAVFPLLMARNYGGDENTAAKVIVFTTIASLVTIPVVLPIAQWWLAK